MKKSKLLILFLTICFVNELIAQPTLVYPKNEQLIHYDSITFAWNEQNSNYTLQIAKDIIFSSIILDTINLVNDTLFVQDIPLNQNYYWRVKNENTDEWSSINSFRLLRPDIISSCVAWFRADTLLTISNDTVYQWNDIINDEIAIQSTSSKRPLFVSENASINNLPSINFDGTDDFMEINTTLEIGTAFVLSNWSVGDALFTNNSGLFTKLNNPGKLMLNATSGSTSLMNIMTTHFINSIETINFDPLSIFKIAAGIFNPPETDTKFFVGSNTSSKTWKGDICEIIVFSEVLNDSSRNLIDEYLKSRYSSIINLGFDINIQYGFCDTTINAGGNFSSYLWSTGESTSSINADSVGTYSVTVTDAMGYISTDSILVSKPFITVINDTTLCLGDTITWDPGLGGDYSYLWQNSGTDSLIEISEAGEYYVQITDSNACVLNSDTLTIEIDTFAIVISLGGDTTLCEGGQISLTEGQPLVDSYEWNDASTDSLLVILSESDYWVRVTNSRGCEGIDTIHVSLQGLAPSVSFTNDTACLGDSTSFIDVSTVGNPYVIDTWLWNFGDAHSDSIEDTKHLYDTAGVYTVQLTATTNSGCSSVAYSSVLVKEKPVSGFSLTLGDQGCTGIAISLEDQSTPADSIASWDWGFGDGQESTSQDTIHIYSSSGDYQVSLTVTANNGCPSTSSDSVYISDSYALPTDFALIWPPDAYQFSDGDIAFSWNESQGSIYYNLLLTTDSLFGTYQSYTVIDTSILSISFTPETEDYYWQVSSYNLCGDSTLSGIRSIQQDDLSTDTSLQLWFRSDSGLVLSNDTVLGWYDVKNNYLARQLSTTKQPQYITSNSEINNQPSVHFDGTDDVLELDTTIETGTIILVSNWSGAENVFPDNKGIFTKQTGTTLMINALSGTSEIMNIMDAYYVNGEATREYGPLSQFKIVSGQFNTPETGEMYYIGGNGSNKTWKGNICEIMVFNTQLADSILSEREAYLSQKYSPAISLGYDIDISYGFADTLIDAGDRFITYLWSTTDTTQTITVNQSGTYAVTVTGIFGYQSSDSIKVSYPEIYQQTDTNICYGDTITWNTGLGNAYEYQWNDLSTLPIIEISTEGIYYVQVSDSFGNIRHSDTIFVKVDSFKVIATLGENKDLCSGNSLSLENGYESAIEYLWSDGSDSTHLIIYNSGEYSVIVQNEIGCVVEDTILIAVDNIVPLPGFEVTEICYSDLTLFTDTSLSQDQSSIINWQWDFGNGQNSTVQNPEIEFADTGNYNIQLTVATDSGCINSTETTIRIHALPETDFNPVTGCERTEIQFTNLSSAPLSTIVEWLWAFNETDFSDEFQPSYSFENTGSYPVKLKAVTNYGCVDSIIKQIEIKPSPEANFDFSPACIGDPVYFNDMTETIFGFQINWNWDFGDGESSTLNSPVHEYANQGEYQVTLKANYLSNACTGSISKLVTIHEKPTGYFSIPDACLNDTIQIIDSSLSNDGQITSWNWDFGKFGTFISQNPVLNVTDTGTYLITLNIETEFSCKDNFDTTLIINANPLVDFIVTPEFGNAPLEVSFDNQTIYGNYYQWNFGDGFESTLEFPVHTYSDSGNYTVVLYVFNEAGCFSSDSNSLRVIVPNYDIKVDNTLAIVEDGFLLVATNLINLGTVSLNAINLEINSDETGIAREQWFGELKAGTNIEYAFTTQAFLNNENPSYVCVKASIIDFEDANPNNNESCYSFVDEFEAMMPYPNPSKNKVNIEFILPYDDKVEINLFNPQGVKVRSVYKGTANEGYNRIEFDTKGVGSGIFTYQIIFKEKVIVHRFFNDN